MTRPPITADWRLFFSSRSTHTRRLISCRQGVTDAPRQLPRPVGFERMESLPLDDVVAALATPHVHRAALWRLVAAGPVAVPYVKRGLGNSNAAVRRGCCEFLDLYPDDDSTHAIIALLDDSDAGVRRMAAHALSCDRCKTDNPGSSGSNASPPVMHNCRSALARSLRIGQYACVATFGESESRSNPLRLRQARVSPALGGMPVGLAKQLLATAGFGCRVRRV